MGQNDSFFNALGGETPIGFFTTSTTLGAGVDVQSNQVGVKGTCQGPVGDGVQGFGSGNFSGVAGFGGSVAAGQVAGTGVFGLGGTAAGTFTGGGAPGVRGIGGGGPNTSPSNAVGVYGQGGQQSPGVVGQAGSEPADGVQGFGTGTGAGVVGNGGGKAGQGVRGIGAATTYTPPSTMHGTAFGVYGQGGPDSDGVLGVAGGGGVAAGVHGISRESHGYGVFGEAGMAKGSNAIAIYGSVYESSAFAGAFSGRVVIEGDLTVTGALQVTGAKAAVVSFPDGSHRRLYSMESPESWFEDFGVGQLVNGQAQVELAPDFAAVVKSDTYHVFISEYEDNNALFVSKRTSTGFSVRAKSSKTAGGTFSYRVVAKRKDIVGPRLEKVTIPAWNALGSESGSPTPHLPPPERARPPQ